MKRLFILSVTLLFFSAQSISQNLANADIPVKYKSPVMDVLTLQWTDFYNIHAAGSLPGNLFSGMNEKEKACFQEFADNVYNYEASMAWCFGLLSTESKGYGYINANDGKIQIDIADQYYRDNVMQNDQILESDNYNIYYTRALLNKGLIAYDLVKLLDCDTKVGTKLKNQILQYGIKNAEMMYEPSIKGYQDSSLVNAKQDLLIKLKKNLSK